MYKPIARKLHLPKFTTFNLSQSKGQPDRPTSE